MEGREEKESHKPGGRARRGAALLSELSKDVGVGGNDSLACMVTELGGRGD